MSDLAFNMNGDGFDVPESVVAWRVRRLKPRGAPELVYGRDGRPLQVPVDADIDELREAVEQVGKYRLDPLTDDGKLATDVPAAYVQVVQPRDAAPTVAPVVVAAPVATETEGIVREAMRLNSEIAKSMIDRFPAMMEAAARLIDAADGAGISSRRPLLLAPTVAQDDDDQDDDTFEDDDEDVAPAIPAGGFDLNALVAQIVPIVIAKVMNGGLDLSSLGALLDWRKATPKAAASTVARPAEARRAESPRPQAEARTTPPAANGSDGAAASTAIPTLEPAAMMHFLAIQKALSPDEAALAKEVAKAFSPAELNAWIADLSKLTVPEAVAKIRAIVARGAAGAA
ncbi:MAG: hypothetical protein K8W52_15390 [Deltaproteobacteria bacterium]|nr:hypothetical protein [Deltaproteobacteria bacterium]